MNRILELAMRLAIEEEKNRKARVSRKKRNVLKGEVIPYRIEVFQSPNRVSSHGKPWSSVSMINDGSEPVLVTVNTAKSRAEHELKPRETYKVDMAKQLINDILLRCEGNKKSVVRVVCVR